MFLIAMIVALVLLSALYASAATGEETSGIEGQCPYPLRKPIPEGVVEITGVPTAGASSSLTMVLSCWLYRMNTASRMMTV